MATRYTQAKKPNLDPVVKIGNTILYNWLGWCLAVAQVMFGSQRTSPSAWSEWVNVVKKKHQDRSYPLNVYFPIWFDGYWKGKRLGHVAVAYWNGKALKIWSSPVSNKPYADIWTSIAQVESKYGMKYVGWSEDIGNTRVINRIDTSETKATEAVAFTYKTENDPTLLKGLTKEKVKGVNGVRTIIYTVTVTNGKQTSKKVKSNTITKQPVTAVTVIGTKEPTADTALDEETNQYVKENNSLLKQILALLQGLVDKITGIFK